MSELQAAGHPITYLDETGVVFKQPRRRGWAKCGERVLAFLSGRTPQRTNIVAGWRDGEVIAPVCYDFSMTADWFEQWFEELLCPELPEGSVIVLDNARFHRKRQLEEIAQEFHFSLLFLPRYSPDKNKIEHYWANLKHYLRNFRDNFSSLDQAICDFFRTG